MTLLNLLIGGGTGVTPITPPIDPAGLTTRRQVSISALQVGKFYPSANTAQTYAYDYKLTADSKDLVIGVDASVAGGSATIVIDGATHRLTFGGAQTFAISGSVVPVLSDPVPVTVISGTTVTGRLYYESVSVQHNAAKSMGINPAFWGPGDSTGTGAGIVSTNNSQRYIPTFVSVTALTIPAAVAVLGTGDSIFESGSGTPTGYTRGATEAGVAFVNAGRWGGQTITAGDQGLPALTLFTHVLDQYGFNDITNEVITKTMADKILTWNWMLGQNPALKITGCTVTPSASSTDGWTTLTNQTPDVGTTYGGLNRWQRSIAYNDWMRDGAPILAGVAAPGTTDPTAKRAGQAGHPLKGYLEIADVIESARNSGKFRVDLGALAVDGVHMNTLAGTQMVPVVKAWAAGLTV